MNPRIPRHDLTTDLHFFGLAALTWISFCLTVHCAPGEGLAAQVLFALGASLWSFLILRVLGYFNTLRLLPRKSDLLLVLVAIPIGAYCQYTLFLQVMDVKVCSLQTMFTWTPVLTLFIFGSHYVLTQILIRSRGKRKIVLDLLPPERVALIGDFTALGMDEYIEFLSRHDLKEHVLRAAEREIDLIVISRSAASQFEEDALLLRAHLAGIPILDHRKISTDLTGRIRLLNTDLWTYLMSATPQTTWLRAFSQFKVMFEPAAAAVLALVLAPVMAVVALCIKLTSAGPVLYLQTRTGYLGKPFTLIKFRSMYIDSEKNGPQWSTDGDRRITPLGKILRKTRLDELPQLWNVIRGEMSFFGPRPERPEIYNRLKREVPLFSMRTIVRPGITGWAQVCAGYAASVEESLTKLEYDLYYIQHMSPRLDLIILAKTLRIALFGSEAEDRKRRERAQRVLEVVG